MANDKSFKIKNGLSATRYLGTNGTETAGSNGPYGTFDTTTYSGTGAYPSGGSSQTITNNIDLATDGGLVWIKDRNTGTRHALFDTERGITQMGNTGEIAADITVGTNTFTSFNSNGFTLGDESEGWGRTNMTGANYVAWTFKQASNFFDVVTYTGNGTSGRQISHNLSDDIGTLIIKNRDDTQPWVVWHRSDPNNYLHLNTTDAASSTNTLVYFSSYTPASLMTTSYFTLGSGTAVNANNVDYVAYLFAHDTSADGYIQCGSYTGTGSYSNPPVIDLGWSPSWIMIKRADGVASWQIYDTVRGATQDSAAYLRADQSDAEGNYTGGYVGFYPTSTGFSLSIDGTEGNASGGNYIYMAIRAVVPNQTLDLSTGHTFSITPTEALDVLFSNPPASGVATGFTVEVDNSAGGYAITWPSSVKWHLGTVPTATASKEVYTFITTDGGTTYYGKKAGENLA